MTDPEDSKNNYRLIDRNGKHNNLRLQTMKDKKKNKSSARSISNQGGTVRNTNRKSDYSRSNCS